MPKMLPGSFGLRRSQSSCPKCRGRTLTGESHDMQEVLIRSQLRPRLSWVLRFCEVCGYADATGIDQEEGLDLGGGTWIARWEPYPRRIAE